MKECQKCGQEYQQSSNNQKLCPSCRIIKCAYCGKETVKFSYDDKTCCSISCGVKNKYKTDPKFAKHQAEIKKGKGSPHEKPMSREHVLRLRTSKIKGHEGPQLRKNGYIYIYAPDHPHRINSRIPEQTLIAEKILGRHLKKGEEVHHINKIKTDNRNCNLLICSQAYHRLLHAREPANRERVRKQMLNRKRNILGQVL